MIKDFVLQAYQKMAQRYHELIDIKPHNAYYDRPNTLTLLPEVAGKVILDAACGPGKYAEILMAKGATVIGFDISPNMVALARERNPTQGEFFVHDLSESLDKVADASCDIVLCALALHYIEDWTHTIQEFYRVLKPKGAVVISIEHPFNDFNFFQSTAYFQTENVQCVWKGFGQPIEVHSYRRPLQACLSPFTENGFYIDTLLEPKPTQEFAVADPKHFKELNDFPAFMCFRAVKRA
jgi:ubiquinone/menaquinone biosynthesis C-methylase UbiE